MSEKIRDTHRARAAYVYVRQSTMHQVRHHQESQRRQYELVHHAHHLGFSQVVVIDEDMGRSGSGVERRPGFDQLVAAVCAGQVGAVVALEAARLARNNREWHHLVDLCALTETVVVDLDGIYDPRLVNDRLLLGLKGTMSEFELTLLRQRAQEALRQKIQRGAVLTEVPVGYVRTEDQRIELTPDRQVQQAIRSLFTQFETLGSARQVVLWYRQHQLPLPVARPGSGGQEIEWRPPGLPRVLAVLKNPCYAGAFAHGRRRTETVPEGDRVRQRSTGLLEPDEWAVLLLDHHEGYISWSDYQRHQEQLKANVTKHHAAQPGAARSGRALLAGLLRCARCGRKLHVVYSGSHGQVPRYHCRGGSVNHGTESCLSVGALRLDRAVAGQVLQALQPAGIEAALSAWEEAYQQEEAQQEAVRLAVEKARYEVERARRQYDAVDPANRLVAAELETRWNQALERLQAQEEALAQVAATEDTPGEEERQRLLHLGQDLPAVWDHPQASMALKKRILRTVLQEIILDLQDTPPQVRLTLHWVGGVHTPLQVPKNRTGQHRRSTDSSVVELVQALAQVCADGAIAAILNRLGYRTGADHTWTESRVRSLRSYRQIPAFEATHERTWLTLAETAAALAVSPTVVRRLLTEEILPGQQVVPCAPWMIQRADLARPAVQAAVKAVQAGRKTPHIVPMQGELPFKTIT